jgi:hypothetical protein
MPRLPYFPFVPCAVLAWVAAAAACGGSKSPSAPSAPTPVVQSISVTSPSSMLRIGATETFTATAAMSNGSSQPVSGGQWGSDNPAVARAEASTGRVTGVGSGTATIYVDYQGRRGTKLIRVVPDFQGTWSGSYVIDACQQSGDFAAIRFCSDFQAGLVLPTNLVLTQTDDRVEGRLFLGTLSADGRGPIDAGGTLTLTGTVVSSPVTIDTVWLLRSETAGRATGRIDMVWRYAGALGDGRIQATIRDLNRTSASTALSFGAPVLPATIEEAIRAIQRRP